ncbi:MAG: Uma2 family endonuclease [Gemmatimonadetes bacterium]|nr:Uma2 family endonuclease [Gemmatimonadota bacterium]
MPATTAGSAFPRRHPPIVPPRRVASPNPPSRSYAHALPRPRRPLDPPVWTPADVRALEILSPTTARHDRFPKRRACREAGVPLCWIVDPDARPASLHRHYHGVRRPLPPILVRHRHPHRPGPRLTERMPHRDRHPRRPGPRAVGRPVPPEHRPAPRRIERPRIGEAPAERKRCPPRDRHRRPRRERHLGRHVGHRQAGGVGPRSTVLVAHLALERPRPVVRHHRARSARRRAERRVLPSRPRSRRRIEPGRAVWRRRIGSPGERAA